MSAPRSLRGVGINIFITNFESFAKLKTKSNIAKFCVDNNISNIDGANIRGGYAEQILNNPSLLNECLTYIIYKSKRISSKTKQKAVYILNSIKKR